MIARQLLLTVIGTGLHLTCSPRAWTVDEHPASVTGADADELIADLDPKWPGAMPHTVLDAQDGTIMWRHDGAADGDELRATMLSVMGAYYLP